MVITSVNRDIEDSLLEDSGFLYSHLAHYLIPCFDSDVSGQSLEASLIAQDIESYETIKQIEPFDLVAQAMGAMLSFLEKPQLLSTVDSLQTVLIGDGIKRPVLGLPAIIMLEKIVSSSMPNIGNVVIVLDEFSEGVDYFELPTYMTYKGTGFHSSMVDIADRDDVDFSPSCLYVPLHVKTSNAVNTDFHFISSQSDWVYRLIRNYTQGHYSLERACNVASKNIDVFTLLVAPILGASLQMITPNIENSTFDNLSSQQQYDIVATIKPLIEYISYDFSRNELAIS